MFVNKLNEIRRVTNLGPYAPSTVSKRITPDSPASENENTLPTEYVKEVMNLEYRWYKFY
jgi:hypothetical protein